MGLELGNYILGILIGVCIIIYLYSCHRCNTNEGELVQRLIEDPSYDPLSKQSIQETVPFPEGYQNIVAKAANRKRPR